MLEKRTFLKHQISALASHVWTEDSEIQKGGGDY